MIIEEGALKHWIDNFYGYGSWYARYWFIGHEEGGGDVPEEVADKLNYFHRVHAETDGALCDIREMYRHVAVRWDGPKANSFNSLFEYRFDRNAIQHGVWKNLIAFVHGCRHEKLPDILPYQQHTFLSPSVHAEALIRLYPLPSPHNHAWYYSWLGFQQLGFLKSRPLYEEHLYQRRIHSILSNISKYKPEVVLMYGMKNINALKKSIQGFFHEAQFRMIKATTPIPIPIPIAIGTMGTIGRQIPQHHRTDVNGTTMLITTQIPALRHNRIETGFDWENFGRRVKED